jgi:copper(I)-binding protein
MPTIKITAIAAAFAAALIVEAAYAQNADPAAMLAAEQPVTIGDLTITQAWSRATPPGAPTAAGYLTIANTGAAEDRLLAVTSPAAESVEIHQMEMADGRMTMHPVEGGLVIPAGGTVVLEPGGFHLMLVGVGDGLVVGTIIEVTLTFANAGDVTLPLVVFPIGSSGPAPAAGANFMGM